MRDKTPPDNGVKQLGKLEYLFIKSAMRSEGVTVGDYCHRVGRVLTAADITAVDVESRRIAAKWAKKLPEADDDGEDDE